VADTVVHTAPATALVQVRIPEASMAGLDIIAGAARMARGTAGREVDSDSPELVLRKEPARSGR
jgi:hypothetical protein